MRTGVLISAVGHVVLVCLAMLGTPKLFDAPTQSIEVDLVRADELEPDRKDEPEPKQPEPKDQAGWEPPPEKPAPWPAAAQPPDNSQQAALTPQAPSQSQSPAEPQAGTPSIFDPAHIPALLDLPNAPEKGFDFESTTAANISSDERAAFKAHLRKCWKLPGSLSPTQTTRVVLRVYLRRDGALASEPVLIEASASRDGPAVMQTALRALKDCQPFGFLPADKYKEWKVLDLSFTPRDMAGG